MNRAMEAGTVEAVRVEEKEAKKSGTSSTRVVKLQKSAKLLRRGQLGADVIGGSGKMLSAGEQITLVGQLVHMIYNSRRAECHRVSVPGDIEGDHNFVLDCELFIIKEPVVTPPGVATRKQRKGAGTEPSPNPSKSRSKQLF